MMEHDSKKPRNFHGKPLIEEVDFTIPSKDYLEHLREDMAIFFDIPYDLVDIFMFEGFSTPNAIFRAEKAIIIDIVEDYVTTKSVSNKRFTISELLKRLDDEGKRRSLDDQLTSAKPELQSCTHEEGVIGFKQGEHKLDLYPLDGLLQDANFNSGSNRLSVGQGDLNEGNVCAFDLHKAESKQDLSRISRNSSENTLGSLGDSDGFDFGFFSRSSSPFSGDNGVQALAKEQINICDWDNLIMDDTKHDDWFTDKPSL